MAVDNLLQAIDDFEYPLIVEAFGVQAEHRQVGKHSIHRIVHVAEILEANADARFLHPTRALKRS